MFLTPSHHYHRHHHRQQGRKVNRKNSALLVFFYLFLFPDGTLFAGWCGFRLTLTVRCWWWCSCFYFFGFCSCHSLPLCFFFINNRPNWSLLVYADSAVCRFSFVHVSVCFSVVCSVCVSELLIFFRLFMDSWVVWVNVCIDRNTQRFYYMMHAALFPLSFYSLSAGSFTYSLTRYRSNTSFNFNLISFFFLHPNVVRLIQHQFDVDVVVSIVHSYLQK